MWLRSKGRTEETEVLQKHTGSAVAVVDTVASSWRDDLSQVQVVLLEMPLAPDIVKRCLEVLRHDPLPLPVVIYDPESEFDEQLLGPSMLAFRHITEHLDTSQLAAIVSRELQRAEQMCWDMATAREPWRQLLVGESHAMRQLHSMIRLAGPRKSTVLITGETGTGKEIVARALHMASSRAGSKMVSVNCAAIPENLFESELFGHTKGAFTGAVTDRIGRFEQAHRGTIFLDEVGEVPLEIQPKLLRVLQERELQRLGGSDIQIDTRVIAASNRDLDQAVADRRFREDLLYRLNVVPIVVPPLRDRAMDIPVLADHFIEKVCRREGFRPKTLTADALRRLAEYEWPGNVRQLEHTIEMAVTLSGERERLYAGDLPLPVPRRPMIETLPVSEPENPTGINLEKMMGRVEQMLIQEALRQSGGNKAKAASSLGIPRTTLVYKLRSIGVCA